MSVPDVLPPSPPTTRHRERIPMSLPFKPALSTPVDESRDSFLPSSGPGSRKRVEFSPWPNVVDGATTLTPSSQRTALKALPPSRDCPSSVRSILKPYSAPMAANISLDGHDEPGAPSPEMIENIAKQLAGNDKGSSVDAYQTLSQIIKTYDEIPDDVNIRGCIASILRCIKRDLSIQDQTQSSPIDTNLMTSALKVSVIFVWSEHLSPLLTDDFRAFIIDRSITMLTEHAAPKIIIIHYMHLLAMQSFRSGTISSNNRAVRLLEALQDITTHVQGKGAVSERLLIYQKLIDQVRPVMKSRVGLWIKEALLGLASPVKDIRDKAISVCTRACAAFPSSPTVSAAAREALASMVEDRSGNNRTLSALLTQRLEKMVAAKDEAIQVPQIWALGLLLCSSTDLRLENWGLLRDWLQAIQRCFNCSDTNVRSQAFPAWNRFIYIIRPHEASDVMVSMLVKPVVAQIERAGGSATGKGTRPAAVSSYCMLLYYAFRPAATHKQYTRAWNEYIVKIMGSQFLSKSTANADLCCRIIMSLMWKEHSVSRIWNENRAHENTFLEPEELPTLDCKWIRSKAEAILQLFRLLSKYSVWGPSVHQSDQAYVAKAWRHFLKAIKESASKEIKHSNDTKKAVSHIIELTQDTPETSSSGWKDNERVGQSQLICNITATELGPAILLETMEAAPSLRSPSLIAELLKVVSKGSSAARTDQNWLKRANVNVSLSPIVQRCVKMLNEELQQVYDNAGAEPHALLGVMHTLSRILKSFPRDMLLPCLIGLQQGLVEALKDEKAVAGSLRSADPLLTSWSNLSATLADNILLIPVRDYRQIDDLLTAVITSSNAFTTNALLTAWSDNLWQDNDVSYGPKFTAAVESLQSQVDINLPGIEPSTQGAVSQIQRDTHVDSLELSGSDTEFTSNSEHIQAMQSAARDMIEPKVVSLDRVSARSGRLHNKQTEDRTMRKKSRHDDSQVHFVPVDSSPQNMDEVESQLLTNHQKEVRSRQRAEQTVTFPDLTFSPRPRSRETRAPSTDCEMARKVAAMQNSPATPTLNRQHDNMDGNELPSPTPKARNKIVQMVDVDIPSSPPSVVGHVGGESAAQDVPLSPPRAPIEAEPDMVTLDAGPLQSGKVDLTDLDTNDNTEGELGSVVDETVENNESLKRPSVEDTNETSKVYETAQEFVQQDAVRGSSRGGRLHSDEIDELSASQLSQSLSYYIEEESRHPAASNDEEQIDQSGRKSRKRTSSGYADRDGKKRRRRSTPKNETAMSSLTSEDSPGSQSNVEDVDMEDCIAVRIPPSVTPSRRRKAVDTEAEASTASSAKKRKRSKQRRARQNSSQVEGKEALEQQKDSAPAEGAVLQELPSSQMEIRTRKEAVPNDTANQTPQETFVSARDSTTREDDNVIKQDVQPKPAIGSAAKEEREAPAPEMNVMTALQTALNGLKNGEHGPNTGLDLKAIEDLCFQIRFQAQEVIQGRKQH